MKNKKDKNYELDVQNKAQKAGIVAVLLLATVFFIVEILVLNTQNYSWYSIIALYCAVVYLYKGIKMPKNNSWFLGAVWLLAAIACIINYIMHRF